MAVKVKALVWEEARFSSRWERFVSNTLIGVYEALEWSNGEYGWSRPGKYRDDIGEEFLATSISEAKAAAQADYERRILSAIEEE